MRTRVLFLSLLLSLPMRLPALGSLGTDFWLAFPTNYGQPPELSFFITSPSGTTGTVSIPGLGFSSSFTVPAAGIINVTVPSTAMMSPGGLLVDDEITQAKGIHVTTAQDATVYGLNRFTATTDAYLGLPTASLGTSYWVASYRNGGAINGTELAVVASQNGTTVTITPSVTVAGHAAGVPYTVALSQGQVYQVLNASSSTADLTGTYISSNRPVGVYGGHACANIPTTNTGYTGACDHIVEMMAPASTLGLHFFLMPLATRLAGDIVRVLASQNGTNVSVNGAPLPPLAAGAFQELTLSAAAELVADRPVTVVQYCKGTDADAVLSDPFEMLIPPFEQYLNDYVVSTPATGFSVNHVNVVAPAAVVGALQLDGAPVSASLFSPIGASGFFGAQVPVSLGPHRFSSALPFGVSVYGFDMADSYGYPGGAQSGAVATVNAFDLSPKSASRLIGSQHCVTATALAGLSPVAGVRVDFSLTGAHPQAGFAFTDAAGQAVYCWNGSVLGVDDIRGSLGSLSDTARCTWIQFTPTATPTPTITPSATITPTPSITQTHTITPTYTATPPPLTLALPPANPNPSYREVWLPYRLGTPADVDIQVYTLAGEPVRALKPGFKPLGVSEAYWDHRNEAGQAVASGVYIYRVRARSPAGEELSAFAKCAIVR